MSINKHPSHWLSILLASCMLWASVASTFTQPALAQYPGNSDQAQPLRLDSQSDSGIPQKGASPVASYKILLPLVIYQRPTIESGAWPMAGANPQRTSWTPEEVRGQLEPAWYRPLEPYIPAKAQLIAAYNMLYVSTAKGLYAFNADNGAQEWVYPTEMPLGNSPTIYDQVAYVGGFDNKIHAINALTGQGLWTFEGTAGFDTNPLVLDNVIYMGGRDGYFYAVNAGSDLQAGTLLWKYKTGGPIHFSAAYKDGMVYFASDDGYAYALNALTGQQAWRSAKLPSAGFHSWWVVVQGDVVILSANRPYRQRTQPQVDVNSDYTLGEPGLPEYGYVNPLTNGTINVAPEVEYFTEHPSLKSFYVLNRSTGKESSILPARSLGTHSGNRYPAVIAPDGTVLTVNSFSTDKYGQGITRWNVGSTSIRPAHKVGITAPDEPMAFSMGGNLIYYVMCCDRSGGSVDLQSGVGTNYFGYNLDELIPGYDEMYAGSFEANAVSVYGGWNGVYGVHGDQNPPIPYKGKLFMHRSNAIIAWSTTGGAHALPLARTVPTQDPVQPVNVDALKQNLATEVQKMISAGHLRPGFGVDGLFSRAGQTEVGDNLSDYWHNPADTILVLSKARNYLTPTLQQQLKTYLYSEMTNYPPCAVTTVGYQTGAGREWFDLPPEVQADFPNSPANMYSSMGFPGWTGPDWRWTPQTQYALWKYAQSFGLTPAEVKALFSATCRSRLTAPPADSVLAEYPHAHNAWIAGYRGYMELEKLSWGNHEH